MVGWSVVPYIEAAGSVPDQVTYLDCRFDPWLGYVHEAVNQCFSLSLPPFSPNNKIYPLVRIKKNPYQIISTSE